MSFPNAQYGNQRMRCTLGSADRATGVVIGCAARRMIMGTVMLLLSMAGGCARRAYNDVYVENMAAEIRDLEDQLYEFDGEYRMMEQQLDALRDENARLKSGLPAPTKNRLFKDASPSDTSSSEFFVPRGTAPNKTNPSPAPSLEIGPSAPSGSAQPKSPTPQSLKPQTLKPQSPTPEASPNLLPGSQSSIAPPSLAPSLAPAPLPPPKPAPGANKSDAFNPDDLAPPTIENGEPMPPTLPPIKAFPSGPVTMQTDNDLELELGQIKLPAQLASLQRSDTDDAAVRSAQIHPAAELPSDTRIVELKFHPSLCRAVNKDQQGDDDGLYLVLQPYNASGEFVALPADLMILAIDLSREEKQATIGRWTMSAADVKSKMNPIGSSQGIHLSLSFSGPAPQCDRVLVFAYYTLADGRRIVAEQEVMLNNLHRQNAVWVPRSQGEVRTVSHETRKN